MKSTLSCGTCCRDSYVLVALRREIFSEESRDEIRWRHSDQGFHKISTYFHFPSILKVPYRNWGSQRHLQKCPQSGWNEYLIESEDKWANSSVDSEENTHGHVYCGVFQFGQRT